MQKRQKNNNLSIYTWQDTYYDGIISDGMYLDENTGDKIDLSYIEDRIWGLDLEEAINNEENYELEYIEDGYLEIKKEYFKK